MTVEDVQNDLNLIEIAAEEYEANILAIADEERYVTLPDRALQVAELATQMCTILDGIFTDAAEFSHRVQEAARDTRQHLDGIANATLKGATNDEAYYILRSIRCLGSGMYEQRVRSNGLTFNGAETLVFAQKAKDMAEQLRGDRSGIIDVATESSDRLVKTVAQYRKNL